MTNNGVFFSELSSLVQDIFCFCSKINHKSKNIWGNIEVMLLKLGISNVPLII